MAIPNEPLNDSQANNPVFQPDNELNLESGCSNEQMQTIYKWNQEIKASNWKLSTKLAKPQLFVGKAEGKQPKTPPYPIQQKKIDSNDPQVINVKMKRVGQNKIHPEINEKSNHPKHYTSSKIVLFGG